MTNVDKIDELIKFLNDTSSLGFDSVSNRIITHFDLCDDNHTYYNDFFAVRFSNIEASKSNCVVSLKKIIKYNDRPFINIQISNSNHIVYLINLSLIENATHTSAKKLSFDNIVGTILIKDIIKIITIDGNEVKNSIDNIMLLYEYHKRQSFDDNLSRIVNNRLQLNSRVKEKGVKRYNPNKAEEKNILDSIKRSMEFLNSSAYMEIKRKLDYRVECEKKYIFQAAEIDHGKKRGNVIESLITSEENDHVLLEIETAFDCKGNLPRIKTQNTLGDFHYNKDGFKVEIDIKSHLQTKKGSAPKGYNVDKVLKFLSEKQSVFLVYFLDIDKDKKVINSVLVPMYHELLFPKKLIGHHAGIGRRGEVQFQKNQIEKLFELSKIDIDERKALVFLKDILLQEVKEE